jgi:hypothetical protein
MSVEINEDFAAALRGMLIEHVNTSSRRRVLGWPRTVSLKIALASVVIAIGGGAAAATTGVVAIPGGTVTTQLAPAVTVTGTGTETVNLGAQPHGANSISLTFTCLTPGTFVFADGSSANCFMADADHPSHLSETLPLALGQNSTVITAGAGERWQATVSYTSTTRTPYKTNANGQTYGTDGGEPGGPLHQPDLMAVQATNGKLGYAYATQLNGPTPTSPSQALADNNQATRTIPVYESDGKTQIGEFKVGN